MPKKQIVAAYLSSSSVRLVQLWALLGMLAHTYLVLQWTFTTWVPWVIPNWQLQIAVASFGIFVHGLVLWACLRGRLPCANAVCCVFGLPYLALTFVLFTVKSHLTGGMIQRDELRYREHIESVERLRAE